MGYPGEIEKVSAVRKLMMQMADAPGSAELDMCIARVIHPSLKVVEIEGEPILWDGENRTGQRWRPVPRYSRSVDAAFDWENIVRVEKLLNGQNVIWRARQYPHFEGDAVNEAIARRLAAIKAWVKNGMIAPKVRLWNGELLPAAAPRSSLRTLTSDDLRLQVDWERHARFVKHADESDFALMNQILLEHVRYLNDRLAKAIDVTESANSQVNMKRGTMAYSKKAMARVERVRESVMEIKDQELPLFSEVMTVWMQEETPVGYGKKRYARSAKRLIEFHGDRPIDGYSKFDLRKFFLALFEMPGRVPLEFYKMPMPSLLEFFRDRPDVPRLMVSSVRTYQKDLQAIFNWAMGRDLCFTNPAYGIKFVDKRMPSELRVGFDENDLRKIFMKSPLYAGCKSTANRSTPGWAARSRFLVLVRVSGTFHRSTMRRTRAFCRSGLLSSQRHPIFGYPRTERLSPSENTKRRSADSLTPDACAFGFSGLGRKSTA